MQWRPRVVKGACFLVEEREDTRKEYRLRFNVSNPDLSSNKGPRCDQVSASYEGFIQLWPDKIIRNICRGGTGTALLGDGSRQPNATEELLLSKLQVSSLVVGFRRSAQRCRRICTSHNQPPPRGANSIRSPNLTAPSATAIIQRRQFTISRWPSGLHPLSIDTISCFGFITNWQGCFVVKTGSMTHMLTPDTPSCTLPIALTA